MAPAPNRTKGVARAGLRSKRGGGRELADWIAELAVEVGLTLDQARDHSLARLILLAEAAGRVRARVALLDSQVVFAAVAAAMHKDNSKILKKLHDALREQSWD